MPMIFRILAAGLTALAAACSAPAERPDALWTSDGNCRTIAQDRTIELVLETAVNSQLPGRWVAITSRPVHASGCATADYPPVLLPAGTRVIGDAGWISSGDVPSLVLTATAAVLPDGRRVSMGEPIQGLTEAPGLAPVISLPVGTPFTLRLDRDIVLPIGS